ncbi:Mad3/BUB1 homology region 1-domain-containing protein [Phyllosticta capitalensis]
MAAGDLISFDDLEPHKENIQRVPGGRSARALASVLSPKNLDGALKPIPSDQERVNNVKRQEFEKELETIDESDDPLDIYDRYVKWTFDTYPNPSTTQSQLLPLLERATKAFLQTPHYKNDPRYLKLWLHYIKLFSDEPRYDFAFVARHEIGDSLALFYEEFAAYLEVNGRWNQAEEVYSMGVDKEARPAERLLRKYGEFQQRMEARQQDENGPSSPALPVIRRALGVRSESSSASPQTQQSGGAAAKSKKPKMAIFTDSEEPKQQSVLGAKASPGGNFQTMAERKKENVMQAQAMQGQKLNGGKRNVGLGKLMVYKDQSAMPSNTLRETQESVNPRSGKVERCFVNLEAVYPDFENSNGEEFCFEELRAAHRGWMKHDWAEINRQAAERQRQERAKKESQERKALKPKDPQVLQPKEVPQPAAALAKSLKQTVVPLNDVNDENAPPSQEEIQRAKMLKKQRREERANRTRKIEVMEVRGETKTVQTNLASPTRPKIKRKKNGAEPTMTFHTKEAMDEIYGIFNQPLKNSQDSDDDAESDEESDEDDTYTSGGDSTTTGHMSATTSEFGDETTQADFTEAKSTMGDETRSTIGDDVTEARSVSEWSEFTESRHIPNDEDMTGSERGEETQTHRSEYQEDEDEGYGGSQDKEEELLTPTSPEQAPQKFVPEPPEDVEVPRRPYRDQVQKANNRLPFMTPIVEKTESSLGAATIIAEQKDYFNAKTPSRRVGERTPMIPEDEDETESLTGTFDEILSGALEKGKVAQPSFSKAERVPLGVSKAAAALAKATEEIAPQGPIIQDRQCNPMEDHIHQTILENIRPSLESYEGYFADTDATFGRQPEIKKYIKAVSKKGAGDMAPPVLRFENENREYTIKRQLGEGAYAPVYLAESKAISAADEDEDSSSRSTLEAIKSESPPTPWEFYMIQISHARLSRQSPRATASLVTAPSLHLARDEAYLTLSYRSQGTLLDLVNIARADGPAPNSGGGTGAMDESLAMFFTIEVLRTVEALHTAGILHGDLKPDNVLARLDPVDASSWSSQYDRSGGAGWAAKGICLIDFGRAVDLRAFGRDVGFVADWHVGPADCVEMREARPWVWQIDLWGAAGVVYSLLWGRYIETVQDRLSSSPTNLGDAVGGGADFGGGLVGAKGPKDARRWKPRDAFKRYWQTELWARCFDVLLNPAFHADAPDDDNLLPRGSVVSALADVRRGMEDWLEANCERGVGLKGMLKRLEERVGTAAGKGRRRS